MFSARRIEALIEPVMSQLTVYRDQIFSESGNNTHKLERFVDCYHDKIQCFDAHTKETIFPDKEIFRQRYATVFRESPDLDAAIPRRFLINIEDNNDSSSIETNDAFFVDCETFRNLVKPIGGSYDGSTGLSEIILEADIVVMYHVVPIQDNQNQTEKFVIRRAWFFTNDEEGLAKKMVVLHDQPESSIDENVARDVERMKRVSDDQIKTSKSLTAFCEIAKELKGDTGALSVFELPSEFIQETLSRPNISNR